MFPPTVKILKEVFRETIRLDEYEKTENGEVGSTMPDSRITLTFTSRFPKCAEVVSATLSIRIPDTTLIPQNPVLLRDLCTAALFVQLLDPDAPHILRWATETLSNHLRMGGPLRIDAPAPGRPSLSVSYDTHTRLLQISLDRSAILDSDATMP